MRIPHAARRAVLLVAAAATLATASEVRAAAIAHWSFDSQGDKGVYTDSAGGHSATPKTADQVKPFSGDAPFGKAVMFSTENNQKGSYLIVPALNNVQKTNLTVAVWVYLTKSHANIVIADWKQTSDAAWEFGADIPSKATKIAPIADLRSGETDPGTTNPQRKGLHYSIARYNDAKKDVPLNEWHHLAWTWNRNPGVLITYLDGEVIGTANQAHTPLDLTPAKNPVRIGGRDDKLTGMDGAIDELWIYNDVLTHDQIRNVMRYNNQGGTGPLAKVLIKKSDGTFALASPAAPGAEPPPPTPKVATPVAGNNNPRRPPGNTVARGNRPSTPAEPTPTAGEPVAAATPDESLTTADDDPIVSMPAELPSLGAEVVASDTPKLATAVKRYTPGRVAGVISCAILSLVLGAYLFWAFSERAKLRAARF